MELDGRTKQSILIIGCMIGFAFFMQFDFIYKALISWGILATLKGVNTYFEDEDYSEDLAKLLQGDRRRKLTAIELGLLR